MRAFSDLQVVDATAAGPLEQEQEGAGEEPEQQEPGLEEDSAGELADDMAALIHQYDLP